MPLPPMRWRIIVPHAWLPNPILHTTLASNTSGVPVREALERIAVGWCARVQSLLPQVAEHERRAHQDSGHRPACEIPGDRGLVDYRAEDLCERRVYDA